MGCTALAVTVLAVRVTAGETRARSLEVVDIESSTRPRPPLRRCRRDDRGGCGPHPQRLGGGLAELREVLATYGVDAPLWYEVAKSKPAPKRARATHRGGSRRGFRMGRRRMVQRCADVLAGAGATMAVLPAGTANLLATNLGIPKDVEGAVRVGLSGHHRVLDVGRVNGERFLVMAGVGFDALMIRDADRSLKDRFGHRRVHLDRRPPHRGETRRHPHRRRRDDVVPRRCHLRVGRQRRDDRGRRRRIQSRAARRWPPRAWRRHGHRDVAMVASDDPDDHRAPRRRAHSSS